MRRSSIPAATTTRHFSDSQDAPWLVQLDRQQPLAVTISGPGGVNADVPGLDCTELHDHLERGHAAGPAAVPRRGEASAGAARVAGPRRARSINPGATVSAVFAPVFRLTATVAGRGAVRSSSAGITCRPKCSASFPSFVPLRLTATPAKGWKFLWSGGCRGTRPACTVPMTAATSARAVFVRPRGRFGAGLRGAAQRAAKRPPSGISGAAGIGASRFGRAESGSVLRVVAKHDVLVVGAGCAGMRAAIEAFDAGADVAMISKIHPVRSHSGAAEGGINAALGNASEDDPESTRSTP